MSGFQNPGWPGCCRPPNSNEHRYIQAADWHSVSVVHSVPIPPDIRNLLDSLSSRSSSNATNGGKSPSMPLMDRRNSSNTNLTKVILPSTKAPPMSIASKSQLTQSAFAKSDPRGGVPPSLPNASAMDSNQRRYDQGDKSRSPSSRNSPSRKLIELDGNLSRRSSADRRPSVSSAAPNFVSKVTVDAQMRGHSPPPSLRHHSPVSSTSLPNTKSSPPSSRTGDRQLVTVIRPPSKRLNLEMSLDKITRGTQIISGASSSGSGSGNSEKTKKAKKAHSGKSGNSGCFCTCG